MVRFKATTDVSCSPEDAFAVYSDVERWPEWTASMTEVERLDPGPLRVGARARVRQPRLPTTVFTVTDVVPGRSFSWQTRGPGVLTTGYHTITPRPTGCSVTAELEQRGLLGPVVAALSARLTRRYLELELSGLKRRCETGA